MKVKKGDKVRVLSGKDLGREGEVLRVFPKEEKVIVAGINKVAHFTKKTTKEPGGIIMKEAPLWISKIAFLCPKCKKAVRLGKGRICRNCGAKV